MGWRDSLKAGSFRNVPFLVQESAREGGRRTAKHEYPLRDQPYLEDLGRSADGFPLDVLVAGDGYVPQRDALIQALETKGAGRLVHPYYGDQQVQVLSFRVRESTAEGGVAYFSIQFAEAGSAVFPTSPPDTPGAVDRAATTAALAAQDQFASSYAVPGQPQWAADAAKADGNSLLGGIKAVGAALGKAAAFASTMESAVNAAVTEVTGIAGSIADPIATLIRAPANLAAGILGGLNQLRAILNAPGDALKLYQGVNQKVKTGSAPFAFLTQQIPPATPSRQQQASNLAALGTLLRQGALIEACRSSSQVPAASAPGSTASTPGYASAADALSVRDQLLQALDGELPQAGDDLYNALSDLRSAVVQDLAARAASLPDLTTYTPPATLPALVIAYRLYGDASREAELIARNDVPRPLFVPGGQPLEVASA